MNEVKPKNLLSLPNEMLYKAMGFLSKKEALKLGETSLLLNDVATKLFEEAGYALFRDISKAQISLKNEFALIPENEFNVANYFKVSEICSKYKSNLEILNSLGKISSFRDTLFLQKIVRRSSNENAFIMDALDTVQNIMRIGV